MTSNAATVSLAALLLIVVVLFGGDPDLHDALIKLILKAAS